MNRDSSRVICHFLPSATRMAINAYATRVAKNGHVQLVIYPLYYSSRKDVVELRDIEDNRVSEIVVRGRVCDALLRVLARAMENNTSVHTVTICRVPVLDLWAFCLAVLPVSSSIRHLIFHRSVLRTGIEENAFMDAVRLNCSIVMITAKMVCTPSLARKVVRIVGEKPHLGFHFVEGGTVLAFQGQLVPLLCPRAQYPNCDALSEDFARKWSDPPLFSMRQGATTESGLTRKLHGDALVHVLERMRPGALVACTAVSRKMRILAQLPVVSHAVLRNACVHADAVMRYWRDNGTNAAVRHAAIWQMAQRMRRTSL